MIPQKINRIVNENFLSSLDIENCHEIENFNKKRIEKIKCFLFLYRVRIIFAGDDVTDEDAINALKGMAMTFRIVSNQVNMISDS